MKKHIYFLFFGIISIPAFAQSDSEKASEMIDKAIALMDSGMINQSIAVLEEAKQLDPDNYVYDYEIAYAHYLNQDYQASLKTFKKVVKYKNADDQCYQMLGNLYDINGYPEKALKSYDKGLKRFPNSGRLYLEKGTVYLGQGKYNDALSFYEQGIYLDPAFPSNYYRATLLYCSSTDEIWGMIYGEIFMNLERNTKRTEEISKLLFDTYSSQIQFPNDTSITISFCKNITIYINVKDMKRNPEKLLESFKIPYGNVVYEKILMQSIAGQDTINLASLHQIRTNFILNYYDEKYYEKYPVALFEYHNLLLDLGLFEAYNYWILMKGNEEEFGLWYDKNYEKWGNFIDWFSENPLVISEKNKFYSGQF